uniref:Protein ARV n=1 Tax=Salix viminalis TaxID=40686 RepID=A0A6N2LB33_SALVM
MEHRCIECGFRIETLFLQYPPGNIRLVSCKAVADEYIECEFMIPVDVFVGNLMFPCFSSFNEAVAKHINSNLQHSGIKRLHKSFADLYKYA